MRIPKTFFQVLIIILWALYVISQIWSNLQSINTETIDPTLGGGLIEAYLEALAIESLVLPTFAMMLGVIALEVAFTLINRVQQS